MCRPSKVSFIEVKQEGKAYYRGAINQYNYGLERI